LECAICVLCAVDVRRYLLRHPGPERLGAGGADERVAAAERVGRLGWFLVRAFVYAGVTAVVFLLVTWATSL